MGGYLYEKLGGKIPIIGVAKTNFATIETNKKVFFEAKAQSHYSSQQSGLILTKPSKNKTHARRIQNADFAKRNGSID